MFASLRQRDVMVVTLAAAGLLMVSMGIRQSLGLFVGPINRATGMGVATISLALAIGQFVWGAVQPIAGMVADRKGPQQALLVGVLLLAAGCALTPLAGQGWALSITLGLFAAAGSGIAGFSVLLGAASQRLPASARADASGVINAGGSFGQFVFAPLLQKLILGIGWMGALWTMALAALATLPLIGKLGGREQALPSASAEAQPLGAVVRQAMQDRSYLLLHAGFFTCGFHIAFLVTHLPGEVNLCGLPPQVASWSLAIIGLANIFGSLYAGRCIGQYRSKYVLAAMYGSRALLVGLYLLAPRTPLTYYLFAAGLGFTWLATVPPTAALVGKLFGTRYLATLFGLTLLSHQVGGFLGAWLGGQALVKLGNFNAMWYADMALAALAAIVNLPIRERPVQAAQPA
ncbi:MFS transporter [Leeia sp.]|uniref:MFS transporter n=1 Tax=Leeia sp. TaxID=2884678 RepID=UPI0035B1598F